MKRLILYLALLCPCLCLLAACTDKEVQYKYLNLWNQLSDELKEYPNDLVAYEPLKEPERKIIIGSNKWQGVVSDQQVLNLLTK